MASGSYNDVQALIAVAEFGSFTRASVHLGISQSAVSRRIMQLEQALGVVLLTRTTRAMSLTEQGMQLVERLSPRFNVIDQAIQIARDAGTQHSGTVRISATDYAIETILLPRLTPFFARYPDIHVEMIDDYALADIVEERCDIGVRLGEELALDMIAVRIGPDFALSVVATPEYWARHGKPERPEDLLKHNCINLRFSGSGKLYAWEFEEQGMPLNLKVPGQLVFDGIYSIISAARAGLGVAYVPHDLVEADIEAGRLIRALEPCSPVWGGYHLYYPNRRETPLAMLLVIDALRLDR